MAVESAVKSQETYGKPVGLSRQEMGFFPIAHHCIATLDFLGRLTIFSFQDQASLNQLLFKGISKAVYSICYSRSKNSLGVH